MKILIDTDVLLDVALNRKEWIEQSAAVLKWAESTGKAAIAWHSLSNCAYLLENDGREFLSQLMTIVDVAETGKREAVAALKLSVGDLEDALQVVAAQRWMADYIVTRNLRDFSNSPVKAISPAEFLGLEVR